MGETITLEGYTVDLDLLYCEMYAQSEVQPDGERLFDGNKKNVRAVKRLINELFDVPVQDTVNPINHAVRSACRDRFHELGWATKYPGRSAKYTLHREF